MHTRTEPDCNVWEVYAARAECRGCGWKGPLRDTKQDAALDHQRHQCPALCNCRPLGGQHQTGCTAKRSQR